MYGPDTFEGVFVFAQSKLRMMLSVFKSGLLERVVELSKRKFEEC